MIILATINNVTYPGYQWWLWPAFWWGIGVLINFLVVYIFKGGLKRLEEDLLKKEMERIKDEFPNSRICLGLSNVSFGLPLRKLINATFITMAISRHLDAVILDPFDRKLISVIKTAEMLMGKDRFCRNYIKAFRTEKLVY